MYLFGLVAWLGHMAICNKSMIKIWNHGDDDAFKTISYTLKYRRQRNIPTF